ncbi:hypothetical protein PTKIN_Ptkin08bG0030500 [Pterospermum kingtungense]
MTVNMHTLNVILLLGDTALNCLVNICCVSFCFINTVSLFIIFTMNLYIHQLPFSGALGFGFLTFSYGRVHMSFFSGSFMLVSQSGNIGFTFIIPNSRYNSNIFVQEPVTTLIQVAISISRSVITICSITVLFSGSHASTMLRLVCFDSKYQALPVVEMVPSLVPVFKIKK